MKLSNICRREYAPTANAIKKQLPSQHEVSLALDEWISMNKLAITSVIAYYMDQNWALREVQLAVINPFSACFVDLGAGRINPGTFDAALMTLCSGLSDALMPLPNSVWDSSSALQWSSLWFGLSRSPFQLSQFSVLEMLSVALFSSLSTGWPSILPIQHTFNTWVSSPGRFFADKAGGKGDLSDNLNPAAPSCWKFDKDALMISSVSEMYPMAVICLIWVWDFFCVAHRFWLPYHISKESWTLAILYNFLSSVYFFNYNSFSVSGISNAAQSPANIALLAWANYLTMTFCQSTSPVVLDRLQPITSCWRENLASSPTPCGIIDNML